MADAENANRVNKIAPEAFAMLYTHFPVRYDFEVPKDQYGSVTMEDASFVKSTIEWLIDEGSLRVHSAAMSRDFYGVVLS